MFSDVIPCHNDKTFIADNLLIQKEDRMTDLEHFWADQENGYNYLCSLPLMRTRLVVPFQARPVVEKLEAAGTLFVVSPNKYDMEDIKQQRIGLSARYRDRPPVIWLNVARLEQVKKAAVNNGFDPDAELIDTIFHEAAHVTGHYLNRLPTATSAISSRNDILNEEAICHLVTAHLWQKIGNKPLAQLNMSEGRKAATKIGKSINALSVATEAAINFLTSA